jgi:prepilin-type N-terminal cleavage/methylation domain-containing protein
MNARRKCERSGFTLLEVIFAIALLLGSLAIIGQFVVNGVRSAGEAEGLTVAELLCQSTLAQAVTGAIPLESASGIPIDSMPDWQYSMEVNPIETSGLLAVRVIVSNAGSSPRPVEFSLIRWVLDPEYVDDQVQRAEDAAAQATAATSSSSSSTGGTTTNTQQ